MDRVDLTEAQPAALIRRARAPGVLPRPRERWERGRLAHAGGSIPQIARRRRRSEPTVRAWIQRLLREGLDALDDPPHRGQPSAGTPAILAGLRQELEKGDRPWTARRAGAWVGLPHGLPGTPDWMAVRLARADRSYQRTPRRLPHQQDPVAGAPKREELAEAEQGALPVRSTGVLGPRRAWPPRCRPPTVGVRSECVVPCPTRRRQDGGSR